MRGEFGIGHMRSTRIGIVASDAFVVSGDAREAVRICLGGPITQAQNRSGLFYMAHALREAPQSVSTFL